MAAPALQKRQRFRSVGDDMKLDVPIGATEGFQRQPDISRIVFDKQKRFFSACAHSRPFTGFVARSRLPACAAEI
jgi:hypothetical protein